MRWCSRCVLPDTRPNLVLDEAGVCNACRAHERRPEIDWESRGAHLRRIASAARSRGALYDCVVPVSGGKDSTWQTIACLELGLRPLCVTWRPPGRTALGQANLDNLIARGVDHIDYSISPRVERTFALRALERCGDPAIPMHMALFAIPLRIAAAMGIPLVVFGENSAVEYGSADGAGTGFRLDAEWVARFGVTHGTTWRDWSDEELTAGDLVAYAMPDPVAMHETTAVFLGHFLPWDPEETYRVARRAGFRADAAGPRTGHYAFADVDDEFISVHHWLKWLKFGFTRTFDNLSLEIRNGRSTREAAIEVIAARGDETPHADIDALCSFLGISREGFDTIAERFRNRRIWRRKDGAWTLPDFLVPDWSWA